MAATPITDADLAAAERCVDRDATRVLCRHMTDETLARVENNWWQVVHGGQSPLDRAVASIHVEVCRAERHRRIAERSAA